MMIPPGRTYYDVFGLSPTARPEQIRAAYVALMKRHHPDLVDQHEREVASEFVAFVNRCYSVLKDSGTRAQYNAFLADQAQSRRSAPARKTVLITGEVRKRSGDKDRSSFYTMALIALTAALAIGAAVGFPRPEPVPWANPKQQSAVSTVLPAADLPNVRFEAPTIQAAARRQVQLAVAVSKPTDAIAASRNCFQVAQQRSSATVTDLCIIFDEAYVDSVVSGPRAPSDYFAQTEVQLRHRQALAPFGAVDDRLKAVRAIALNLLLAEINQPQAPAADPSPNVARAVGQVSLVSQ